MLLTEAKGGKSEMLLQHTGRRPLHKQAVVLISSHGPFLSPFLSHPPHRILLLQRAVLEFFTPPTPAQTHYALNSKNTKSPISGLIFGGWNQDLGSRGSIHLSLS